MKQAESNDTFSFPWGPVTGLLFGFFAASEGKFEFVPGAIVFCIGLGALLQAAFDGVTSMSRVGLWLLLALGGLALGTGGGAWGPPVAMAIVFAALAFNQSDRERY